MLKAKRANAERMEAQLANSRAAESYQQRQDDLMKANAPKEEAARQS